MLEKEVEEEVKEKWKLRNADFLCLVAELLTKSDSGTHLVSLLLSLSLSDLQLLLC